MTATTAIAQCTRLAEVRHRAGDTAGAAEYQRMAAEWTRHAARQRRAPRAAIVRAVVRMRARSSRRPARVASSTRPTSTRAADDPDGEPPGYLTLGEAYEAVEYFGESGGGLNSNAQAGRLAVRPEARHG